MTAYKTALLFIAVILSGCGCSSSLFGNSEWEYCQKACQASGGFVYAEIETTSWVYDDNPFITAKCRNGIVAKFRPKDIKPQ